jgi:glutathione S-transferase
MVPVLEDGSFRLTESAAILIYLAEKNGFPEYPQEVALRAKVNEVMFWASFNFYREWGYNLSYPQLFPHNKRPSEEGHKVAVEWGRDKSAFWLQVL